MVKRLKTGPRRKSKAGKIMRTSKKTLINNGTRITRTKRMKAHITRCSSIRKPRHTQFPGSRSEPKVPLSLKKQAMEYKRQQDLLSDEKSKDEKLTTSPKKQPVPRSCEFDHTRPRGEVVDHFFKTPDGMKCLQRNWVKIDSDMKCAVIAFVVRSDRWDTHLVEMIMADESFIREADPALLCQLVRGIGDRLADFLRTDDCCVLWHIFRLNNEDFCNMLVDRIRACRSDVVVKCHRSFEIMAFVVRKMAGSDESRVRTLWMHLLNEVHAKMLLFRHGCHFLGAFVVAYPEMSENAFQAVSMEAQMDRVLCHEYKPVAIIPMLSDSAPSRAMSFLSRIVINAVVSVDREALSPLGMQVVVSVVAYTRANRKTVWVSDDVFEKAEVMAFLG